MTPRAEFNKTNLGRELAKARKHLREALKIAEASHPSNFRAVVPCAGYDDGIDLGELLDDTVERTRDDLAALDDAIRRLRP